MQGEKHKCREDETRDHGKGEGMEGGVGRRREREGVREVGGEDDG